MITNPQSGTNVHEIADHVYRINTPVPPSVVPGGFNDLADRPARALQDGESVSLGKKTVRWLDTPHLPHAWECGFLFESRTRTLLCGDLFTQPGADHRPLTEGDILGPSEAFRGAMDYDSHTRNAQPLVEKLATTEPTTLASMHGAAWRGDGAKVLRALGATLAA
jgi:glyoxylase-like metal-dependent hydrolase (beta-lactamase superfamily II)